MLTMTNEIDIAGLDKAEILAALFNFSEPVGMGVLQAYAQGNHDMTLDEANALINGEQRADNDFGQVRREGGKVLYFDYIRGRPIKANLEGDTFNPAGYDRDHGDGMAAALIDSLR